MSVRNFKSAQKIRNVVLLYFSQTTSWGDSAMSVTIPVADAKRLMERLQEALAGNG